jgi:hypothetical protein
MLDLQLADTAKARLLRPDGTSVRARPEAGAGLRSQERLYELIGARRG